MVIETINVDSMYNAINNNAVIMIFQLEIFNRKTWMYNWVITVKLIWDLDLVVFKQSVHVFGIAKL